MLCVHCYGQDFLYATYSNPYQNSFAFATPNLKQMFTTRLATPLSSNLALNQAPVHQLGNLFQQNVLANNIPANYPQQQQQNYVLPSNNFYTGQAQSNDGYSQTFSEDQLRQQLAYMQLRQQQQRDSQLLQQFQAPFIPSPKETPTSLPLEQTRVNAQNLLGVSYSPSTKVSQVKFDSAKLKYDF